MSAVVAEDEDGSVTDEETPRLTRARVWVKPKPKVGAAHEALVPEAAKVTKSRLTLRTWRYPRSAREEHAYIAGTTDCGGLSEKMETVIPFEIESTRLSELRPRIEVRYVDGMNRRTALYHEFYASVCDLDNPHGYPEAKARSYRLGAWRVDEHPSSSMPRVIPIDSEDDLVAKWFPNPLEQDLVLIPQCHVAPNDVCSITRRPSPSPVPAAVVAADDERVVAEAPVPAPVGSSDDTQARSTGWVADEGLFDAAVGERASAKQKKDFVVAAADVE